MLRLNCSPEEDIVRAIHNAHFDEEKGRLSSSLFKGQNTSVSRLAILPLPELFKIFHEDLDKPPERLVYAAGEINIGHLIYIGESHSQPLSLTVEEAILPHNTAHAEIPQKISKGLALRINRELKIHSDNGR